MLFMYKFIILLFLPYLSLNAEEYIFDEIHVRPGFEINFQLLSDSSNHFGELSCQSFIQKLDIFDQNYNLVNENYISIRECEELFININNCFEQNKRKCINTENIFSKSCSCN